MVKQGHQTQKRETIVLKKERPEIKGKLNGVKLWVVGWHGSGEEMMSKTWIYFIY